MSSCRSPLSQGSGRIMSGCSKTAPLNYLHSWTSMQCPFCYLISSLFCFNQNFQLKKNSFALNDEKKSDPRAIFLWSFDLGKPSPALPVSFPALDPFSIPAEMFMLCIKWLLPAWDWWLRAQNNQICTVETWLLAIVIMQLLTFPFCFCQ